MKTREEFLALAITEDDSKAILAAIQWGQRQELYGDQWDDLYRWIEDFLHGSRQVGKGIPYYIRLRQAVRAAKALGITYNQN